MSTESWDWAREQFEGAPLGDVRRVERASFIAGRLLESPGSSLPALFPRRYDVKAAYALFAHPQVTPDTLQAGHRSRLREVMSSGPPGRTILLVEDTSAFSWSGKAPRSDMGPVGSGKKGLQGFFVHSVLAIEWVPERAAEAGKPRPALRVLGLADQQYFVRLQQRQRTAERDSKVAKARQRESEVWSYSTLRLGEAPAGVRWIRVCDREADIYEFLTLCQERGHGFLVRATQDRTLAWEAGSGSGGRLFAKLRALPPVGGFSLSLRARPQHPAREAVLSVAFCEVTLRSPQRPGKSPGGLPGVRCTAVRVWEANAPATVKEPLEWMLLCDQPVRSAADAAACAQQYSARWLVEEYHKVLKTGLGAERLQLETSERLYAAIALLSVVAVRIVALKEAARIDPFAPAEASGLTERERRLLALRLHRELKTVRDVILALGRLGGHMGSHQGTRVDHLPGWLTLWRGMQALQLMVQGADLAASLDKFGV
jgi:hypothetical protein